MVARGDLVRHPAQPSWGIGKVLKVVQNGNILVRFEQAGEKILHPETAKLRKIETDNLLCLVVREVTVKNRRTVRSVRVIPIIKQEW
ncbi:MAG: DUF3553 domain-containing protein [Geobacter sp.]|nr:DUF3553 domain-containing protein [Geobacter sp.]